VFLFLTVRFDSLVLLKVDSQFPPMPTLYTFYV